MTVLITLFYLKKRFFILNDNIKTILYQNIVLPIHNLGGGGDLPSLPDSSYGPEIILMILSNKMIKNKDFLRKSSNYRLYGL